MLSNAKWIRANENTFVVKKEINLKKAVKSAVLSISAMGCYICKINGERVGNFIMAPGWTEYRNHTQFQEYDVLDMLSQKSQIEVSCGNGWAASKMGLEPPTSLYTDHVSCIFSLKITYADESTEEIVSDKNSDIYSSDVVSTDIYNGEVIDRTFSPKPLGKALEDNVKTKLVMQMGEDVTTHELVRPLRLFTTPKGEKVVDFGQNMTGFVRIIVDGKPGDRVRISHGEVLDCDGNFYGLTMRNAKAMATYILGSNHEVFEPEFTFYGFRYIKIEEFPGKPDVSCFLAVELHSDIEQTSSFVSGNIKLNHLYSNIIWGQKDNFLDIPTDCPQRDERLGWTGDAMVFSRTAAINFDVERFFEKWLFDVRVSQRADGGIPHVVPDVLTRDPACPFIPSAAWSDVAVVCPWEVYNAYGNIKILSDNFECMKNWVEYIHSAGEEEYLWLGGEHYGDWLGLDAYEGSYKGSTDEHFIASCFFAYSTSILIKAGKALGKDMTHYEQMYNKIKEAINNKFVEAGLPTCVTQTACVLLLHFDICEDREKVIKLLVDLIKKNGGKLTTGFVGTPYLLHALSDNGQLDLAYDMLLSEEFPSWFYMVNHGATTMWEHWDGVKEDGSFWSPDMNSFNHYAYGSVFDWIFKNIGGISINENGAGYRDITIAPKPDIRLGFADTSIKTRNGQLRSYWRYTEDFVRYEIEVPAGTKAKIVLPDGQNYLAEKGKHIFYSCM